MGCPKEDCNGHWVHKDDMIVCSDCGEVLSQAVASQVDDTILEQFYYEWLESSAYSSWMTMEETLDCVKYILRRYDEIYNRSNPHHTNSTSTGF